jgi:ubiquinone/menaquinone biosynthesis C-methylase UbiE
MSSIPTIQVRPQEVSRPSSTHDQLSLSRQCLGDLMAEQLWVPSARPAVAFPLEAVEQLLRGLRRRWRRERRRRKVGRAYDMALEIANIIPRESSVLDVGCGNGYITHHLSAMLGANVVGIDLGETTEAPIDYRRFDGKHFPVADQSFDVVSLCYVLHHAQNIGGLLSELRRVLRAGGLAVVYEDIPNVWWDRFFCWTHDFKWHRRTGPCTFRDEQEWRQVFTSAGFEIVNERPLSRWRNLAHPVCRRLYALKHHGDEAV